MIFLGVFTVPLPLTVNCLLFLLVRLAGGFGKIHFVSYANWIAFLGVTKYLTCLACNNPGDLHVFSFIRISRDRLWKRRSEFGFAVSRLSRDFILANSCLDCIFSALKKQPK